MASLSSDRDIRHDLEERGFCFLPATELHLDHGAAQSLAEILGHWEDLPADEYLRDGGRYRFRRHGAYRYHPRADRFEALPEGFYYQAASTNQFAGGISRVFGPLAPATVTNEFLLAMLRFCLRALPVELVDPWRADVHLVRVIGDPERPGHPTPEGIHNDGFDYVSLHMIARHGVQGGETFVYSGDQPIGSWVLEQTLDSVFVDDRRLRHYVSPIRPATAETTARRDMLLLSFVREANNIAPQTPAGEKA